MRTALSAKPWSVWLCCLLVGVGAARDISAQPNRPLTAEQVLSIRDPGDVQISPDGRRVAFVITEPRQPGSGNRAPTNIWLVPTDGSAHEARFEDSSGAETSPRWSPDGRSLAFLSARETVEHFHSAQLYVRDIAAGKTRRLSNFASGVESFRWSADGSMIALLTSAQSLSPVSGAISVGDATVVKSNNAKSLWVTGLASGEAVQITKEDTEIYDYAWSPKGNEFALEIASGSTPGAPQHRSLVVMERSSGRIVRSLTDSVGASGAIQWSPDGEWISFFAATPREVPCWLAIVPASGGTVHLFMKEAPGTIVNATWTPDAKHLLAEMMEGTHQALYRLDVDQDRAERVLDFLNMPQFDFAYSAAANTIAYLNQSPHSPNDVWIAQTGGLRKKITDLNPQVATWQLGDVREVSWKSTKDGSTINGVIVTPPGFQLGHPYATVVQTHPGWVAWWSGWQGSWWAWGQLLASHGYVVFLPNYRGVWGQGWKWFDAIADWGGMTVPDLLDGVDYLVQQKIADPHRIGIGGWSNGGFVAAAAITQSSRFRAAVLDAPLTDLSSCQALPNCAFLRVHLGDPYEQHARYDELSPVTHIRDCHTPTLLLHGAEDNDDPIGQSYEFYYGLKNLNREAEMVVYAREPHNIAEPAHQIDLQNRVLKWFDEHLKNP